MKSEFCSRKFWVYSKVKDFAVLFLLMFNVSIRLSMLQCFPKRTYIRGVDIARRLGRVEFRQFVTGGEKEVGRHYLRSCHLCRGDLTFVEDLFQESFDLIMI